MSCRSVLCIQPLPASRKGQPALVHCSFADHVTIRLIVYAALPFNR